MDSEVCSLVASSEVVCCQFCIGCVVANLVSSIPTIIPGKRGGRTIMPTSKCGLVAKKKERS